MKQQSNYTKDRRGNRRDGAWVRPDTGIMWTTEEPAFDPETRLHELLEP